MWKIFYLRKVFLFRIFKIKLLLGKKIGSWVRQLTTVSWVCCPVYPLQYLDPNEGKLLEYRESRKTDMTGLGCRLGEDTCEVLNRWE